jgi:hypothetical protein
MKQLVKKKEEEENLAADFCQSNQEGEDAQKWKPERLLALHVILLSLSSWKFGICCSIFKFELLSKQAVHLEERAEQQASNDRRWKTILSLSASLMYTSHDSILKAISASEEGSKEASPVSEEWEESEESVNKMNQIHQCQKAQNKMNQQQTPFN